MEIESEKQELFQNGSIWVRADFHLHTKKDREFIYHGEENNFINEYVAKLKEQDIRVGVISNHNKFDIEEFKALRKKARKEEIFLLPGVELSVNDGANGIHTLVIFNDEWIANGKDFITQFLNVAFQGKAQQDFEQENGRSNHSILDTIKELEIYKKDFILIFAHVEDRCGFWNGFAGGRIIEFGKNESFKRRTLGFQKVRTIDKGDKLSKKQIREWLRDWYPAEVEGSDCKSIEEIGKGEKGFIKIGAFTFGAVKFALQDYQRRVAQELPHYTHSHIDSISFTGGILDGQTVHFAPGLNTLIGIRGSGKSSIFESLRYVMDIPFGEKAIDTEYKDELIVHTLGSGGKAIITAIDRQGNEFEIQRILNELPNTYQDGTLLPGVKIRETIIYKPVYFGQKDLSNTGKGFEKNLVEKLIGEKLTDLRKMISEQKERLTDAIARLKKSTTLAEQKKEYEEKKQDAEFRLKVYKDLGIGEELQKQEEYDKDSRKINVILKNTGEYLTAYANFISRFEDDLSNLKIYDSQQNVAFFKEFFSIFEGIIDSLRVNRGNLAKSREYYKHLNAKAQEFAERKNNLKEEFAGIKRKLSQQLKEKGISETVGPDDFLKLKNIIEQAIQMLELLEKQQTEQKNLKDELEKELNQLNILWHEEFITIRNELQIINTNQPALEIIPEFKGDKEAFVKYMKDTFKGSRIRDTHFQSLAGKYVDIAQIYHSFPQVQEELGANSDIFNKYFMENLGVLLTWQVPNKYTINYRNRELKHHSLGQRASALILFILSQKDSDLVIIDQPEDDLDNQTIYEDVIKFIREAKASTQFIFATHNANFPVLGDAEQVHSCRYMDEKIQLNYGSLDKPGIQEEIINIMEGGEEAFEKRKEIYEAWNPQNS